MGVLEGSSPLQETVARCAVLAATADPRFPPLTRAEIERVRIEVSVLGAPRPIAGPEEVAIGREGVIVGAGAARGLLLPQIASEQHWDAERLLEEACRKAGLRVTAWREAGVTLQAFEAEVFGENAGGR